MEHVLEPFIRFTGLFHLYWKLADHRHIFHAQTSQPSTLLVDELGHSRFAGRTIIHSSLHNVSRPLHFIVVFDCMDMFSGLASIFTVTLISLERMHAISWPLCHRSLSNRIYVAGIALPWILAAMVTSTRLLLHFSIITRCHFVILLIISLSSPLTITICCYRSIWKNIKSRPPNPHRTGSDEKLIKTLMLLTVCFLVTWLPFEVLVVFLNFCVSCRQLPMVAVYIIKFLHYSNSVVNFIVYPLRINEFKETLVNLFPWKRGEQMSQFSRGITVLSKTTFTGPFHSSLTSFDPTEETSQL